LYRDFPASEVRRASMLSLSSALPLASRQSFLALGSESGIGSATLLACTDALVLVSHAAILTRSINIVEASGAA